MQQFDDEDKLKDIIRYQYVVDQLDKPRIQEMLNLVA